jgi:hypothetical protein
MESQMLGGNGWRVVATAILVYERWKLDVGSECSLYITGEREPVRYYTSVG